MNDWKGYTDDRAAHAAFVNEAEAGVENKSAGERLFEEQELLYKKGVGRNKNQAAPCNGVMGAAFSLFSKTDERRYDSMAIRIFFMAFFSS